MQTTYLALAMRTNSTVVGSNPAVTPDLMHATLGFADELYEYNTAKSWLNAVEELGDFCWFVALAASALNCDPFADQAHFAKINPAPPLLAEAVGEFVTTVKKAYAYGAVLDSKHLRFLLGAMVMRIAAIAEAKADRSMDELLSGNIAKLQARYPEKFTAEAALTRDLRGEALALRAEVGTVL